MFRVLGFSLVSVFAMIALSSAGCSSDEIQMDSAVATMGVATEDVFLHGTVTRDGKAVSGAKLEVVLEDELAAAEAEVGDIAESFTTATAITDDAGTYTLRMKADELPSKYFNPGGRDFLNFTINVVAGEYFATWSGTMYPAGKPAVWRSSDEAAVADAVMRANFDLDAEEVSIIDSFDQTATEGVFVMSAADDVP